MELINNTSIDINEIPQLDYNTFCDFLLKIKNSTFRCVNYFAHKDDSKIILFAFIASDIKPTIEVACCYVDEGSKLHSLSKDLPSINVFEREIEEQFNIKFEHSPWNKPLRFPFDRKNKEISISDYPFFKIENHELHQVGVGPIHAGIIEPGHFRFICNGEKVIHLEIQLGYQHRGIENLMISNNSPVYRNKLAEIISGDTVVGHTLAHSYIIEALTNTKSALNLELERSIALELERIAMHTFGLSALSTDVAYQFGCVALQDLRTIIINTFMTWCGNRFAHKLIEPAFSKYPITNEIKDTIRKNLQEFKPRFEEVTNVLFNMPSVLNRFESIGIVTEIQAKEMQFVGMTARTCGLERDVRKSNPFAYYNELCPEIVVLNHGDVKARAKIRQLEIFESIEYIYKLLELHKTETFKKPTNSSLKPNQIALSLTEGWRGEVCHTAITDEQGNCIRYKVKDPSLHNWMALALSVRNNDISDFPICNKSFDLSYCGFDL